MKTKLVPGAPWYSPEELETPLKILKGGRAYDLQRQQSAGASAGGAMPPTGDKALPRLRRVYDRERTLERIAAWKGEVD